MNLNSRTHEQINQSDLHQTPVNPILKCLNSEQYPLLGVRRLPPHLPLREISDIRSCYYSLRSEFKEKTESWGCNSHYITNCQRMSYGTINMRNVLKKNTVGGIVVRMGEEER